MLPRLHVVTDSAVLDAPDFARAAEAVLWRGGPDVAFHLRGPHTEARRLLELGRTLRPDAREAGAWFLVNDRLDVALVLDADGVQLGQRSVDAVTSRQLLGDRPIGVSVHSAGEAREATGADFLIAGAIYATASHPDVPAGGVELVQAVVRAASLPVIAIGGIRPEHVGRLLAAGAAGVAVLGGIWRSDDPAAAASRYIEAVRTAEV